MAVSLRQIRSRIKSVENTWKVTRAMEMISVSKFRKVQSELDAARRYFSGLDDLLHQALLRDEPRHPFFIKKQDQKKEIVLCVVASDSGLCGGYNDKILKSAEEFLRTASGSKIKLILIGKKAAGYFLKRDFEILKTYAGFGGRLDIGHVHELCALFMSTFADPDVSEIYMVYLSFVSAMLNRPVVERILPIDVEKKEKGEDHILEPGYAKFLEDFLPFYICEKIRVCLLEAYTSEHGERTVAMKSATDNAKKIIEGLVLTRNKVRQAAITKEVIEIISGAEALKG